MTSATPPPGGSRTPRHAAPPAGRGPGSSTRRPALLAVLGVTAALAVGIPTLRTVGDEQGTSACPGTPRVLELAAAPELAPLLEGATGSGPDRLLPEDPCLQVRVQPRAPEEVASDLASARRGEVDAWVPDSSLWLDEVDLHGPATAPASLATSPVVLALGRADAERLGWPGRAPDVSQALTGRGPTPLRLALVDPQGSAVARIGLAEVAALLEAQPDGRTALARALRVADRSLPDQAAALDAPARGGLAVPAAEQIVRAAGQPQGETAVVAWYPPGRQALDYPLVAVTDDPAVLADLEAVRRALASAAWTERTTAAGFRAADGTTAPSGPVEASGIDTRPLAPRAPDPHAVRRAVSAYDALARRMRMLAVLDVSGSMAQPVPGTQLTRMEAATAAAANGLGLLPDDTQVGLWVFASDLTPTSDHRQLAELGPLSPRADGAPGRETLARALSEVQHVPGGDTGLHDTVLAAVRAVREEWDPERVNSVVLITDGRNDDAEGVSLPELLDTLRREGAERPVPVIGLAYGPDVDLDALRQIGRATGGTTYHAQDPRRIGEVLEEALALRTCRPDC